MASVCGKMESRPGSYVNALRMTMAGTRENKTFQSLGQLPTQGREPLFDENWSPPKVLGERYRIEQQIGQGGFGVVYRAYDNHLDLTVAVKFLSRGTLQQFRTEARSIAALNHVNLVRVYDFNQQDELYYIAMEYISGGSLANKLKMGPLALSEALSLGCQLCEALVVAHRRGIIHRDINPANVLLTSEGIAKLTDFGLACSDRSREYESQSGTTVGTPYYMSPEQLRNSVDVDTRSDLWSVVATFYAMVTGEVPQLIRPDRLELNLQSLVSKGLEEDPERRYQSAKELLEAFRGAGTPSSTAGKSAQPLSERTNNSPTPNPFPGNK